MEDVIGWILVGVAIGFIIGAWLTSHLEANYIIDKSKPLYRTPMCVGGNFYYAVPEKEYNELKRESRDIS